MALDTVDSPDVSLLPRRAYCGNEHALIDYIQRHRNFRGFDPPPDEGDTICRTPYAYSKEDAQGDR